MPEIIRLVEFRERYLEEDRLTRAEALLLHAKYQNQVRLEWPSPLTGGKWRIRSLGWVGYLTLSEERGILLEPKVPLRSLFAMLEYAFDLRGFSILAGNFACETLPEFCVLDTKYKGQGQVLTPDYSQVIAYADALGCSHSFLVYPKSLEIPFDEKPGRIRVQSCVFDLGGDLADSGRAFLDSLHSAFPRPIPAER